MKSWRTKVALMENFETYFWTEFYSSRNSFETSTFYKTHFNQFQLKTTLGILLKTLFFIFSLIFFEPRNKHNNNNNKDKRCLLEMTDKIPFMSGFNSKCLETLLKTQPESNLFRLIKSKNNPVKNFMIQSIVASHIDKVNFS